MIKSFSKSKWTGLWYFFIFPDLILSEKQKTVEIQEEMRMKAKAIWFRQPEFFKNFHKNSVRIVVQRRRLRLSMIQNFQIMLSCFKQTFELFAASIIPNSKILINWKRPVWFKYKFWKFQNLELVKPWHEELNSYISFVFISIMINNSKFLGFCDCMG